MATPLCPKCHQPVTPGAKFCRNCGQLLTPQTPAAPPPPPVNPPAVSPASPPRPVEVVPLNPPSPPKKPFLKRPSTCLIVIAVLLLAVICLAVIGAGGYYAVSNNWIDLSWLIGGPSATPPPPDDSSGRPSQTPSPSDTPEPTVTFSAPSMTDTPIGAPSATFTPYVIPGLGIELPHLTDQEEIDIGNEAAAEFESQNSLSADQALIDRVTRIGQQIVPQQPRTTIPFIFKVVDTSEINAFALPGGHVYVTTGLLDFVESDDELAGVIGHEIAHVALRHGAQQIEAIAAAEAALQALATSDPNLENIYADNSTQIAVELVATIAFAGWGRQAELDADEYGAIYMFHAGYNPQSIIDLFTRFQSIEDAGTGDILTQLLATHPPFDERIARVQDAIQRHSLTR